MLRLLKRRFPVPAWLTPDRPTAPVRRTRLHVERLEERCNPGVITNLNDDGVGSLREVVENAVDNEIITFAPGLQGTINLTDDIEIDANIDLRGPGSGVITIDAGGLDRIFDIDAPPIVRISDLTLTNGGNVFSGGAIRVGNFDQLLLTNVVITNSNAGRGGAISVGDDGYLELINCTITGNTADVLGGGAIYLDDDVIATIQNSTINNNTAYYCSGGGIFAEDGVSLTVLRSTISGNRALGGSGSYYGGGGIYMYEDGGLAIRDSTISGNYAYGDGGGIYNYDAEVIIENSTISGNTAYLYGGGIFHNDDDLTIVNSTIDGNTAAIGGGLYINFSTDVIIDNSTITSNTATDPVVGGGGIFSDDPLVTVRSTIIALNIAPVNTDIGVDDVGQDFFDVSNSLIQVNNPLIVNDLGGNIFNVAPLLGPLQNNGGFLTGATGSQTSILTRALLPGSPGIDGGANPNNLLFDERGPGFLRVFGADIDMGAFEIQPVATTTVLVSSVNPSSFGQAVTFTATVTASVGGPATGTVQFFDGGILLGQGTLDVLGVATFTTSSLAIGTHTITATYLGDASFLGSTSNPVQQVVQGAQPPTTLNYFATGADAGGGPQVNVYNADSGELLHSFYAFSINFTGGVRVAVADVTGDGIQDIICAAGPGGGPQVVVVDGRTFGPVLSFYAFTPTFTGGVFVAVGDVNADGRAEIITGAGAGGGPQVTIFDGLTGTVVNSFFAFNPTFTGGVTVAAGDVNADGRAEVIAGAGAGGGPQVTVYDALTSQALLSFFAFDASFTGGVFVSAGDTNGDGRVDIIAGAGSGGGPQVSTFNGLTGQGIDAFFALPQSFSGGVRVGFSGAAGPRILTSAGPGGGPQVSVFNGPNHAAINSFFAYPISFNGGVFIGG